MEAWRHITLTDVPWQVLDTRDGVSVKPLGESSDAGPPVMQVRFEPNYVEPPHWHKVDTLYVITAGELSVGAEGVYRVGDVRWVRAGTYYGPEEAGPDGCEFLLAGMSEASLDDSLSYDASTAARTGALRAT